MKIILASSSPFRREVLAKLHLPFTCQPSEIDETPIPGESPENMVSRLTLMKARAVAHKCPVPSLVIGSDQAATFDKKVIGKPGSYENARNQLQQASGKKVTFLTGICVINTETGSEQTDVIPFTVHFRKLTNSMIENYLRIEEPFQCAGSFKSEGLGISLFEKLEGDDPNTLIGLPLIRLIRMLENEGIQVI